MLKQSIESTVSPNQSTILPDDHLSQIEQWLLEDEKEEHILKKKLNNLMMKVKRTVDSKTPRYDLH
ncbi:MAG: hypothetical protein JZU47_09330 [Prolixibacteraceae bacterium]|nr:hypothetical protein [Prolixibacteraceae bacterium]